MKKLHELIQYALIMMDNLKLTGQDKKKYAFAVVRCRLEEERYIKNYQL